MDFEQVKNLFNSVVGTAAEKGTRYAGAAKEKAAAAGRIAKLTVELAAEKEALKKVYVEIGQAYYDANHDCADGLFAQLVDEVDQVRSRTEAMEAELAELKASFKPADAQEPDVEVTFEAVVEGDEQAEAPAEEQAGE